MVVLVLGAAALSALAGFGVGRNARRAWPGLLPLVLPALLLVAGLVDKGSADDADCYEECGYEWTLLFAGVAFVGAVTFAAGFYAALARE